MESQGKGRASQDHGLGDKLGRTEDALDPVSLTPHTRLVPARWVPELRGQG